MQIDLKLIKDDLGRYDIDFFKGDFLMTEGLDTALTMSIYGEKRANVSEVSIPQLQRGWWGNLFGDILNYQYGSKLWLLYQARRTQDTLNRAIAYAEDCVSWLIDDDFADRIVVNGDFTKNGIELLITLYNSQSIVGSFSYELWQKTGT